MREIGLSCLTDINLGNLSIPSDRIKSGLTQILFYHDLGKATSFFQDYLKSSIAAKPFHGNKKLTHHALISACFAAWKIWNDGITDEWSKKTACIAFTVIRKHHGNLEEYDKMSIIEGSEWQIVETQWRSIDWSLFNCNQVPDLKEVKNCINQLLFLFDNDKPGFEMYFLTNLFFSILTYSDKTEVVFGSRYNHPELSVPQDWVDTYKKAVFSDKPASTLSQARESIYAISLNHLQKALPNHSIYILNVPTGSGKTLAAINLALNLIHSNTGLRRVIYALPFTSIIDQTAMVLSEVFEVNHLDFDSYTTIHHHLAEPCLKYEESQLNPDQAEMLVENWDKSFILTTFWQLFQSIISGSNSQLRKFHQMANSIIILDEIQSLPSEYWPMLREFLPIFCRLLNSQIILMSATMPKIFNETDVNCLSLISLHEQEHFFGLWNRYKLILIRNLQTISLEELALHFKNTLANCPTAKYLFIFNTIGTSIHFHQILCELIPTETIFYLSSNIVPFQRQDRLKKIRNYLDNRTNTPLFVVSTQLIEAGVDLDFDIVYRDLAPLDSLVQSAGRCNRNARIKVGECFIFHYHDTCNIRRRPDCQYIYSPIMLDATMTILRDKTQLSETDIHSLVHNYYQKLHQHGTSSKSDQLLKAIQTMDYDTVFREFRIIQDYIPSDLLFIELDEKASEILSSFHSMMTIDNRFERQKEFLSIRQTFYQYMISPYRRNDDNLDELPAVGGFKILKHSMIDRFYHNDFGWINQSNLP